VTVLGVVVASLVFAVLFSARRTLLLVTVSGRSMEPQYFHGNRVLAARLGVFGPPRKGDVVVVRRPAAYSAERGAGGAGADPHFIKNVVAAPGDPVPRTFGGIGGAGGTGGPDSRDVTPDRCFLVLGRHPASEDSKQWGYVHRREIVGKVLWPHNGPGTRWIEEVEHGREG
jgi:signal peptidase I